MDAILDNVMVGLRRKLLFVWDQQKCVDSGFKCLEKKEKPIFLKPMKKIWENKYDLLPFRGGKFSESNTLMIDDEPHIALINPPNTAVFPPIFKVGNGKDTFLGPKGDMQKFLDGLVDADDVPTYVKEHPLIGQPAITASHRDWDYYAKIIRFDQQKCVDSGFKCLEKKEKPIFLKPMKKIWENKYDLLPFRGGKFSESNTLMIDDEPHIALINPPNTAVFPPIFKVGNGKDTFLGPKGDMQKFLDGLVDADDVPTYVKEHPLIGQPAITASHRDWDYYAKIIRFVGI
ncbi:hypothetical protein K7X08_014240 [Anisodus acutangulus]|uniref:Mitochondrial import inner membrane translocase subunit TIM50 n=1 Tax=Anisodus acutangulus TaxID=402998 RepID=A0A9Q1R2P6_9SOLA|nr:hypothetical protein K7X08_014240 [Anisodus acutangulus]